MHSHKYTDTLNICGYIYTYFYICVYIYIHISQVYLQMFYLYN